ncbi:hypothetical protein [Mesonia sp. HuA40]|uniref:hypothetical protein n=1 Tax=Mesonia sp. HuA40 TaxID=2602761 RepID=UPI0011C7CD01|nr:hypothetical protein [Mesonia sp. HuA40]TXK73561.1 hypothetical protein FT993_04400 [Mesonia sp. HuA40]
MRKFYHILFSFLALCFFNPLFSSNTEVLYSNVPFQLQEINKVIIRIEGEKKIIVNQEVVQPENLVKVINAIVDSLEEESLFRDSATLIISESSDPEIIQFVKQSLKKTQIRILNVQQRTEINQEKTKIGEAQLALYDSLVKNWKQSKVEDRILKAEDLEQVEYIYQNMTFEQRIKAEKLPDFLPFVEALTQKQTLSAQRLDLFTYDTQYRIFLNNNQVKNDTLKHYSIQDFVKFYTNPVPNDSQIKQQVNLFTKD